MCLGVCMDLAASFYGIKFHQFQEHTSQERLNKSGTNSTAIQYRQGTELL